MPQFKIMIGICLEGEQLINIFLNRLKPVLRFFLKMKIIVGLQKLLLLRGIYGLCYKCFTIISYDREL
jgi:hypothetical protein